MATDSSHSVIMGKRRHHVFSNAFNRILFILAGNDIIHESLDEFEIWPYRPQTELAALERMKKNPIDL